MQFTWQTRKGPTVKTALSVTSIAGTVSLFWGSAHPGGPVPSSAMALVTPTRLSLLALKKIFRARNPEGRRQPQGRASPL